MIITEEMTLYLLLMVFGESFELKFHFHSHTHAHTRTPTSPSNHTFTQTHRDKKGNTLPQCYRQIAFTTIKPLAK